MALIKKLAKSIKKVLIQELLEDEIQEQKATANVVSPTNKENNAWKIINIKKLPNSKFT